MLIGLYVTFSYSKTQPKAQLIYKKYEFKIFTINFYYTAANM